MHRDPFGQGVPNVTIRDQGPASPPPVSVGVPDLAYQSPTDSYGRSMGRSAVGGPRSRYRLSVDVPAPRPPALGRLAAIGRCKSLGASSAGFDPAVPWLGLDGPGSGARELFDE